MVHAPTPAEQRRQARRQARVATFLEAARTVLVQDGVDGLTMARVAAEAEVAVGGLYRYFAGKDALLAALQAGALEQFDQRLARAMATAGDPLEALRAAGRVWFAFADDAPERFALLDASLSDPTPNLDDEAARRVDGALQPVLSRVAAALDAAVAAGALVPGDTGLRTHALWATVHGAAHLRKRSRLGAPDAAAVRELAVDAMLTAWSSA